MHQLRTGWIVLAALLGAAHRAEAACAVALEGAAAVVEPIRSELNAFEDDGTACVAVWVACHADGDHVDLDLRDELGRSAQRSFTSAAGAAAFVISWTQRPLPARDVVVRPEEPSVLPHPAAPAPSVRAPSAQPGHSRWPSQPWHAELATSAVQSYGGNDVSYGVVEAALLRQVAWLRYGAGVRLIGSPKKLENDEAELTLGVAGQLSPEVGVRAELVGAHVLYQRGNGTNDYDWGQMGLRGGARVTAAWHLSPSIEFEVGGGFDGVRTLRDVWGDAQFLGSGVFRGFGHVELGARWSP